MFTAEHITDNTERPHHTPAAVQAKSNSGTEHDPYEAEANDMANSVVQMPASSLSAGSESVQRKCAQCEEETAMRKPITPFVQTKNNGEAHTSPALSNSINSSRGGGNKMDGETRSFMESRFGNDFSNVNIHTGNESAMMNRELSAKAFTVGNDIYFNEGEYNPQSGSGKHLLAHELTHTIQQNGVQKGIQKQAAPVPRKKLWLNIGFDSSAVANATTMARLRASIATLRAAVNNCCTARNKACDVDVQPLYDWNRLNKPAPTDNDYDSDIAADRTLLNDNIDNINTGRAGGLRLLVTGSALSQTWQGVRIFANANTSGSRIAWNVNVAPNETIAHETGHSAGYNGGDIEGGDHSSDPNNLMSRGDIRNAGALPDANWCDHVAALAV